MSISHILPYSKCRTIGYTVIPMELNWIGYLFFFFFRVEHFCMWKLKLKLNCGYIHMGRCLCAFFGFRYNHSQRENPCLLLIICVHCTSLILTYWKEKKGSFGWLVELCVVTVQYTLPEIETFINVYIMYAIIMLKHSALLASLTNYVD